MYSCLAWVVASRAQWRFGYICDRASDGKNKNCRVVIKFIILITYNDARGDISTACYSLAYAPFDIFITASRFHSQRVEEGAQTLAQVRWFA